MSGRREAGRGPPSGEEGPTHHDDPLELIRTDVPIPIAVEEMECLTESLALVALDELGELVVWGEWQGREIWV